MTPSKIKPRLQFNGRALLPRSSQQIALPAYEPNCQKIAEFHDSPAKIRALFGGNRAGKSESGGFEIVDAMRRHPGRMFWACAISWDFVKVTASKIFKYLAPDEIDTISWYNSPRRIPAYIRHINGAELEFKPYKAGIESFAGQSCQGIWLDEDPALAGNEGEQIFVECLQRTLDCSGQVWITATPILGKNWMWNRIYQTGLSGKTRDVEHWTVSLLENKFVAAEEKERARALLTADEIERRFYGLFTTLEGAVFKELRPEINFIPRFPIPVNWRKVRSIDLGFVNAFCCLWGALSPDNTLYIYLEHYQSEMLLEDHAAEILRLEQDLTLYADVQTYGTAGLIEETLCDHDRQERAELEKYEIYTTPANKDVRLSIQIINRLLKPRPSYDGNERPQLYVFDDLPNLTREMQNYRWNPKASGGKEEPIKEDDHAVDALRYMAVYFFEHMADDSPVEIVERSPFSPRQNILA